MSASSAKTQDAGARKRRQYAQRMPTDERREQLLDAARHVAVTDGMRDVNMERIAREAGVTKPVVYGVFGSAETMLEALTARENARALDQIHGALPDEVDLADPVAVATAGVAAFVRAVRENRDTWRFITLAEQMPEGARRRHGEAREDLVRQIAALMEWGFAQRASGPIDPELAARLLISGMEEVIRLVVTTPDAYPDERIVGFAAEFLRAVQEG
jgi:AcrR family transcriptional regulator